MVTGIATCLWTLVILRLAQLFGAKLIGFLK
jgi:hypothetical protein